MSVTIENTSEFRGALLEIMQQVRDDKLDPAKAKTIIALADQVNKNMAVEAVILKTQLELKQNTDRFGEVPISCKGRTLPGN